MTQQRQGRNIPAASSQIVSEIIGRAGNLYSRLWQRPVVDRTRTQYEFWSKLRRGKEPGYELGALFAQPIAQVMAAWALGQAFSLRVRAETALLGDAVVDEINTALARFVGDHITDLRRWYADALALGDGYIVINPDGTLALVSPDAVTVETDRFDYRRVLSVTIRTEDQGIVIEDAYYPDRREIRITKDGLTTVEPFGNPLGVIPIVGLHIGREPNETNGHPVYEALLPLMARYDDVLSKSLDGVEIMGRPIPVAVTDDPERDRQLNATRTESYVDADGSTQTRPVIDWDGMDMLWLKGNGNFTFAAPGSFSADSVAMLKKLFYLLLEHTQIPEWAWGGAIASSKASVEAQMPAFVRTVDGWRGDIADALLDVCGIWLANEWLLRGRRMPAVTLEIDWPDVVPGDEQVALAKLAHADKIGALSREAQLRLLALVEDPAAAVAEAETEAAQREAAFENTLRQMQAGDESNKDEGNG